jgi:hypothetical protein
LVHIVQTLLFVDDQVIIADSEVNLQTGEFTFYNIQQKIFGMEISLEKLEMMAFLGQDPVRCKIVVHNNWLQKVENFKCLCCETSYENVKDIQQKLT